MRSSAKWIWSLSLGLALAWNARPASAQQFEPAQIDDFGAVTSDEYNENYSDPDNGPSPGEYRTSDEGTTGDGESYDSGAIGVDSQYQSEPQQENTTTEQTKQPGSEIELIKERFPDGSTKIEREVTQDSQGNYVNHGYWKQWDEKGNLLAQGEYQYGNRTGTWIRWYRNPSEAKLLTQSPYDQFQAPFVSQATFKNDLLDGAWTIYDAKKRKISQFEFHDGKRHGTSLWAYASGHKMREIQYRDGDMDGTFAEWGTDGKVRLNDTYQAGRKLAKKTANHPGGQKKSEGMYLFAKEIEQTPDDWWNCKLMTMTKTGKDEKHGAWKSWYSGNQPQLEGNYEHDVQVGSFIWWHSNGQKALQGKFREGKQDGAWTWWYANGQKSIHGEYTTGNPTGRWTWWKEDGKVAQSANLSHGEGIVIDTPKANTEEAPIPRLSKPATKPGASPRLSSPAQSPRLSKPVPRQPVKR